MKCFSCVLVLLTVVSSVLLNVASPTAVFAVSETGADTFLYEPVLESERDAIVAETKDLLSIYTIEATLDPGSIQPSSDPTLDYDSPAAITGTLELHFVNITGSPLETIYFRLYANDERYDESSIEIDDITVEGEPIEPVFLVRDTVAEIGLLEPLGDGASATISLRFTTTVGQSHGVFSSTLNMEPDSGTLSLAHWYPVLAGYDPDSGWVLDSVSTLGDIVFSNTALYDVKFTAAEGLVTVAPGSMVDEIAANGAVTRRYVSGPVREFTVIVDDDFESLSQNVDGTTITVWFNPGHEAGAVAINSYGVQVLATFNDYFGMYPFDQLHIVEGQLGDAGGIEYSQLVGLDTLMFQHSTVLDEEGFPPRAAEAITAHEIAHQWFYGLVGNNNYDHAFLDEGLTETATVIYFEHWYGPEIAEQQILINLSTVYATQYATEGDVVVDTPTDDFQDDDAYYSAVYAKAALGFLDIREKMAADTFVDGVRIYVADMRFDVASPDDLRLALEDASGHDLGELWSSWFEEADARVTISVEVDVDKPYPTPTP